MALELSIDEYDPNLARADGLTPIMASRKSGNEDLEKLLIRRGAKAFDPLDKKTRALLTKVSAELLEITLDEFIIETSIINQKVDFNKLADWWTGGDKDKKIPPFLTDIKGDAFGNPIFIDIKNTLPVVKVSAATIKETADLCGAKFWGDFATPPESSDESKKNSNSAPK